jgi:hypothetical protein
MGDGAWRDTHFFGERGLRQAGGLAQFKETVGKPIGY